MTQIRHQKRDVPVASLLGLLGAALPIWLPAVLLGLASD